MASIKAFILALVALASTLAVPAYGQVTAYAAGQGPLNRIEVGIEVRASVRDRCGFAAEGLPSGAVSQADFDRTGINKEFAIRLNCSGASRIAVSSLNGGMTTAETAPGYAQTAPYNVELRMVGDNGTVATGACTASALKTAGACAFSGSANKTNGLLLNAASTKANGSYLRVNAQPYAGEQPLQAGSYSDTLIITVSIAS